MKSKQVTISIDKSVVHSWLEGGLWSMRLIEAGEAAIAIRDKFDNREQYEVVLVASKEKN